MSTEFLSFFLAALETKKRTWGDLVQTDAAKWRDSNYPVPSTLIPGARKWLLDLAEDLALKASDECQPWFERNLQGVTNDRTAKKVRELMECSRATLRLLADIVDVCGITSFGVIQRGLELAAYHGQLSMALFDGGKVCTTFFFFFFVGI